MFEVSALPLLRTFEHMYAPFVGLIIDLYHFAL